MLYIYYAFMKEMSTLLVLLQNILKNKIKGTILETAQ